MDTSDQYLDCLCRTCLNEVDSSSYGRNTRPQQWQFIFDRIEECGALRIAELLSLAVPQMEMLQSDELPKKICCKCLQELLSAYRFQQMCVRSEEQMRAIVSTKESDVKISMDAASKELELVTNDTEGRFNEFLKNEPPKDGGDRMHSTISVLSMEYEEARIHDEIIDSEAAQSSAVDHLQSTGHLLEHCKDSQGEFSEFIKSEHSKEDTRHSTISIERKEEQVNVSQDAIIEPEAAQSSDPNQLESIDQLPEHCNDSQGEFSECIKNEPIEDDEPNIEYSDDDTIHSTISVTKEEVLAIECEEGQTNLISPRHHHEKENNGDISGKRDSTHSDTSSHLSITHSIAESNTEPILKQHACASCDKSFKSAAALKRHVCTHTGERVECEKASSLSRKGGNKRTHTSEKPHKCDICEKRFIRIQQLRVHKRIHTGEKPETRERNMKALREEEATQQSKDRMQRSENKPFECPLCPLRFRSIFRVNEHKQVHEGIKREACNICGKTMREEVLSKHKLLVHSQEKPHKCDVCEKRFISIPALRIHTHIHTGEKPFKCKYCVRAYSTPTALNGHLRVHLGDNIYRCEFCPLAFPLASKRRLHFATHKNEDAETRERNKKALEEVEAKLRLNIPKAEGSKNQLKDHISCGEYKPYECPHCPLRFRTSNLMKNHKQIHEGVQREACDICGKKIRKTSLRRHKLIHSKEKLHKCDFCGKRFISVTGLRYHISKHTGEKPFKCQYCECAFARPNLLTQHLRSHLGDNVYRCEFCPSAFPLASERRSHLLSHKNEDPETRERNIKALQENEAKLRLQISKEKTQQPSTEESAEESDEQSKEYNTHSENKPYECPYCPLRFRTKRTVREHKEIHEGVKLAACDICGKKVRKRNLNVHKRTHREEKLHECDLCEKRFTSTQRLRIHKRRHAGEKRFKCKYCKRAYCSSCTLNSHLRTHLGDNVFRCEFCPLAFPSASERRLHLPSHKNEDPETRERNMNALRKDEAKLRLQIAKQKLNSRRQKTSS